MPRQVEKNAGVELRFAPDDTGTIAGYAAVWGRKDLYGDIVQRGAFSKSLAAHRAAGTRPLMLWSHDMAHPVGVWREIREDDTGLYAEGRLVLAATAGRDAHELLKAEALNGLSIGFRTIRAEPARGGRLVHEVELHEISLVARPAQSAARIASVRAAPVPRPDAAGLAAFIRQCAGKLGAKHGRA